MNMNMYIFRRHYTLDYERSMSKATTKVSSHGPLPNMYEYEYEYEYLMWAVVACLQLMVASQKCCVRNSMVARTGMDTVCVLYNASTVHGMLNPPNLLEPP